MTRAMAREMAAARARAQQQQTPAMLPSVRAMLGRSIRVPRGTARTGIAARTRLQSSRRWQKNYRPNDHCKRHRIEDDQPKTSVVSGYRRRI